MNYTDFATYMESLALSHKLIDHSEQEKGFFIYEREDVLAGIVNSLPVGQAATTMFILPFGVDYNDKGDSVLYQKDMSYMILVFVEDVNDLEEAAQAMDKSELICHSINKKMKADVEAGAVDLAGIEYDDIEMNPILRFHGNFYGFQVFIPVLEESDTCIDDTLWEGSEENEEHD